MKCKDCKQKKRLIKAGHKIIKQQGPIRLLSRFRDPPGFCTDAWFRSLKVGDKVETYDGRIETIRKKYEGSFMLGFDADGRGNCAPDGYFPIAICGCRPINRKK